MKIYEEDGVQYIEIIRPSNFHVHWRELEQLSVLMGYSAVQFAYALGMPNTKKPLTTAVLACAYDSALQNTAGANDFHEEFCPFTALYLTNETTEEDIRRAKKEGILVAKLYPVGATTNSAAGVTDLIEMWPIFEVMQEVDLPLSVHCEYIEEGTDFFDRERKFVDKYLQQIVFSFPMLRVIFEHVSTAEGVNFVMSMPENIGATITPQHIRLSRNDIMGYPSRFCYPVVNSHEDQEYIFRAVQSGVKKFFLGTDSAPHDVSLKFKEGFNGGCFTEPYALTLYAEAFEIAGALDERFERFASINGPEFYGLPVPKTKITLVKKPQEVADILDIGGGMEATPFFTGKEIQWSLV